ncbi:hypothetical protein OC846_005079, partial [Tilletia horrida]
MHARRPPFETPPISSPAAATLSFDDEQSAAQVFPTVSKMQAFGILALLVFGITVSAAPFDVVQLKASEPIVLSARDFVLHGPAHGAKAMHAHDEKKQDELLKKITSKQIKAAEVTISKTFRFFFEEFDNKLVHKKKLKKLHDKTTVHGG